MSPNIDPNAFLIMFDDAWAHSYESLGGVLKDVGELEAAHVPSHYVGEEVEPGWPHPGSILWQVAHLGHCKTYYTSLIEQRGEQPGNPAPALFSGPSRFFELNGILHAAHAEQRRAMAKLTHGDMALKVGNGMALPEFLSMIIRHDIWHASQIAVARRAWRSHSLQSPIEKQP